MKILIAAILIIVGMSAAYAGGFMLLHVGSADGGGAVPGCAVPDAPDGSVDLSKCSNSYYVAVILF